MIYQRDWRNTKETESVNVGDKLGRKTRSRRKEIKDFAGVLARVVGETLSDDGTYREKEVTRGAGWGRQHWRQRMSGDFNMWSLYHQVEMLGSKYEAQVAQILKICLQCRRPGFSL